MIPLSFAALLFSMALLGALCIDDPKRRRTARLTEARLTTAIRRPLALCALLPGVLLAVSGDAAAFLLWLGGCATCGWLLTQTLSR